MLVPFGFNALLIDQYGADEAQSIVSQKVALDDKAALKQKLNRKFAHISFLSLQDTLASNISQNF
jgi:hypothetical protein